MQKTKYQKKKTTKKMEKKTTIKNQMRKSIKKAPINNTLRSSIVRSFLQLLNLVKLYHWKTYSYSQHKATDELYSALNEHIDTFVEILLGKNEARVQMLEKKIQLFDSKDKSEFKEHIHDYREFLIDMNTYFDEKRDSDLLNVRDEILGDINQFLYLLTFDK